MGVPGFSMLFERIAHVDLLRGGIIMGRRAMKWAILLPVLVVLAFFVSKIVEPSVQKSSPFAKTADICRSTSLYFERIVLNSSVKWTPPPDNNGSNTSIEALYANIIQNYGESFHDVPVCDTDRDGRLEYADAFGNPLIVLFGCDTEIVVNKRETKFRIAVSGLKGKQAFALWSMGPNGVNEYGSGDDMCWVAMCLKEDGSFETGKFAGTVKWAPKE
jgi:hypothetical protein